MDNTVVAVFDTYAHAENALNDLLTAGFARKDIQLNPESDTSAATDTTDTGEHGSTIGNFFRSLFGMEEHDVHRNMYSEAVRRGHCVMSVDADTDEQRERAVEVLNRHSPVDIDERAAHWRSQGWTGYDETAPRMSDTEVQKDRALYTQGRDMSLNETAGMNIDSGVDETARRQALDTGTRMESEQRIPVVEEQLRIGKREVERGGVRVFQRLREKPVHESVNLRDEHVKVERHPVDQPASEADMAAFKEGSVELRETAEEPVVQKTARVVEEVVVGKEVTQRTEDINDTVRRTDVEVEQLGASGTGRTDMADTMGTADDADFRRHWQTAYGTSGGRYEDYDAAYRYGSNLAGSDRMKNYRWQDIEPDVRSDWESSHPGSTWDKVKDAVRYGAERVTGRGTRH